MPGIYDEVDFIDLPDNGDPQLPRNALLFQFILCIIGLIGGLAFIGVGVYLLIKGLTGAIHFAFKLPGVSAELSNAGPGLVVALFGVMVAVASLYFYKVTFGKSGKSNSGSKH